jgi:hypothetical protein
MTEEEKRELCLSWINNMDEFGLDDLIEEYKIGL